MPDVYMQGLGAVEIVQNHELLVLEVTRFHLTFHHPFRPLRGWLHVVEQHTQEIAKSLEQESRDLITRSLLTDLSFIHSPSR